ncbi:MAG: murein lipoprotein [Candidatus Lightella neohaematopini]|nr:murein lipoprotein [Candidatus Lightella neohaematopini]MCV2502361.1 murein lipoprotein [Candidatus Lightella neohaematopini]MCV2518796.1 murein lipoprotein [Candidatus Lightella neohaematopini]MCV2524780.1 murein lipoprotein [Candidatus Lightella neohaematopini]
MNYIKLIQTILVVGCFSLVGCSNKNKINQISSEVKTLDTKFNKISNDVDNMHSDIQNAKNNAVRANQRLDNQITNYRK